MHVCAYNYAVIVIMCTTVCTLLHNYKHTRLHTLTQLPNAHRPHLVKVKCVGVSGVGAVCVDGKGLRKLPIPEGGAESTYW